MAYSSKDFESLWFLRPFGSKRDELERLTKAEGLPKNISIEEFFASKANKFERCSKHGVLALVSEQSSSGLSYFRQVVQEDA